MGPGPPRPPKGPIRAKTDPFGGPRSAVVVSYGARAYDMDAAHPVGPTSGTWAKIRPPGAAKGPQKGLSGWAASISCARAPYETTTALLGPPKGPIRAQKGPFRSPGGPWAAPGGLIWAQVPLVGPTGWAAFISCARAP